MAKIEELTTFIPASNPLDSVTNRTQLFEYVQAKGYKGIHINGVTRFKNGVFATCFDNGGYYKLKNWNDKWDTDSENEYKAIT